MVKCGNCGVDVDENFDACPNCGSELKSQNQEIDSSEQLKCSNCGTELPQNTLFCSTCGEKVENSNKNVKTCPNCGIALEENITFCQECGANIFTGQKNKNDSNSKNMSHKFNFNVIVKPLIVALIFALLLSFIGLLIGFSWYSFVIAIILSVGIFAAAIDNETNAVVFGVGVGLILGILETPLVEFTYGAFVAGFYEGFFGSHLILFIILGGIIGVISNLYFKKNILNVTNNFKGML